MKRLYVARLPRDGARRKLAEAAIGEAVEIALRPLRLDTLPQMVPPSRCTALSVSKEMTVPLQPGRGLVVMELSRGLSHTDARQT